jgi:hypothetical protein
MSNLTLSPADKFCAAICTQVQKRLKVLSRNNEYRSDQLCGADYWDDLTSGEQKNAGKCILKLIHIGLLPLVVVKKRHEYPLVFALL